MGGGTSVEIGHIYTHLNKYDGRVLTRVSTFLFGGSLPMALQPLGINDIKNIPDGPILMSPTGKIGILVETNVKILEFKLRFENLGYTPQRDGSKGGVEEQLSETFGKPGGLEWFGYTVSLPPPTSRFQMAALIRFDVKFKEHHGVYRGIYGVPMVFGFYNVKFADHYALGLTALQPEDAMNVDTSVRLRT
jgi:hypothetical protein